MLGSLRLAGYVRSVRGAQGGHELACDPESIRMDQVVESLDGVITVGACLESPNLDCSGSAAQLPMWGDVRDSIVGVLRDHTLADLSTQDPAAVGGRYSI